MAGPFGLQVNLHTPATATANSGTETMSKIASVEELEALYGLPKETSLVKEVAFLSPGYRQFIEASPFVSLATTGPEGLDCSPRGDRPGFVRIQDQHTLLLPDRRGNNRIDSLKNIVRNPHVALLFLVPGSGNTLRVNGRGHISTDAELLASFAVEEKAPRSVLVVEIDAVYFQCARAIVRSHLWDVEAQVDAGSLPSAGSMLAELSDNRIGGEGYDREWGERAKKTLW